MRHSMALLAMVLTALPGCWHLHGPHDQDWGATPTTTVEDLTVIAASEHVPFGEEGEYTVLDPEATEVVTGRLDLTNVHELTRVYSTTYWGISWPVEHEDVVGLQHYSVELYDVGPGWDGEPIASAPIDTFRTSSQGNGHLAFSWSRDGLLEQGTDGEYSHEFGFALVLIDESGGDIPAVWGPLTLSVSVDTEFEGSEDEDTREGEPVAELTVDWQ